MDTLAANNSNKADEMYQMSSFTNVRTALQPARAEAMAGDDSHQAPQQQDVFNYYCKDATSSGSTNSGSTSGCGTMATSSASGFGGGRASGSALTDIREHHSQSSLDEMDMVGVEGQNCSNQNDNNYNNNSSSICNKLVVDNDISLELDIFQDRNCDKSSATAATISTKNSQYDVPFKFKQTFLKHLK